jgi:hypothetical protein
VVQRLRAHLIGRNGFDVVHSWGVLHHTDERTRARPCAHGRRPDGLQRVRLREARATKPVTARLMP